MSSANGNEMKQAGIIRRIDDLGRIVIPREIRNKLRIREDDPLEMFIRDNTVVLMKYNARKPIKETLDLLYEIVEKDRELNCGPELLAKVREMIAILERESENAD